MFEKRRVELKALSMNEMRKLILFLWIFYPRISDQNERLCSVRSKDYSVINDFDYQPTNSLLKLGQLTVMNVEICAFQCLSQLYCLTATFQINTGQCILYYENMIRNQLIPLNGGYVLTVNENIYGNLLEFHQINTS